MHMNQDDLRLSRIDTLWSVVRQANETDRDKARQAQQDLLDRYGGAVRRYLLGSLRNEDAADEVFQEFSLNLVRGAFQNANPDQGRFRNFIKTSLFHLIIDYHRRARHRAAPLQADVPDSSDEPGALAAEEEAFTKTWREDLLARAWQSLAETEQKSGKPYHSVLRFRFEHSEMHSPEIAEQLGARLGKPLTAGAVRVLVHRARELFADLLLDAVCDSLDDPSRDQLEEELIDLKLLEYCRSALERRGAQVLGLRT
jgi:RNA polymerase sigma factor (sigma-70 family)